MSHTTQINDILHQVQKWPMEERVALAYRILREMQDNPLADPPRQTWRRAVGMLRASGPAPSDKDVKRWVEEQRLSKYGS